MKIMQFRGAKLLAFGFLLLASISWGQTGRWIEVGGNDQITAYVDTKSIRRTGSKVKVWLKWINTKPADTDAVYPKKQYMSAKALSIYHCVERTSVTIQVIRYAESDGGEVVETLNILEKPERGRRSDSADIPARPTTRSSIA